ncbi:MAG TPA: ATP-binding cassette domain-containing protein, partial [Myxococcaceae bacterium]
MAVAAPAVKAKGLTKRFGTFTALDGLDLEVERGAFFAFLGPNGAGKSTTISILTGVYARDGGELELLGLEAERNALA